MKHTLSHKSEKCVGANKFAEGTNDTDSSLQTQSTDLLQKKNILKYEEKLLRYEECTSLNIFFTL